MWRSLEAHRHTGGRGFDSLLPETGLLNWQRLATGGSSSAAERRIFSGATGGTRPPVPEFNQPRLLLTMPNYGENTRAILAGLREVIRTSQSAKRKLEAIDRLEKIIHPNGRARKRQAKAAGATDKALGIV